MNQVSQQLQQLWQRFRQLGRGYQIGIGCAPLIVVCVVCSCGLISIGALSNGGKSTVQATATTTHHVAPTATATPKPAGVFLGSTGAAFIAKFGAPANSASASRTFQVQLQGQDVFLSITLDQSSDTSGHVQFLLAKPSDSGVTWDSSTGLTIIKLFMPTDATFVKTLNVSGFGTEQVYQSNSLAHLFPDSVFTDANTGAQVAPGTFYYVCNAGVATSGGCDLNLGDD